MGHLHVAHIFVSLVPPLLDLLPLVVDLLLDLPATVEGLGGESGVVVQKNPIDGRVVRAHPDHITQIQILFGLAHNLISLGLVLLAGGPFEEHGEDIAVDGDFGILVLDVVVDGFLDFVVGEVGEELEGVVFVDFEEGYLGGGRGTLTVIR